jgi:hypothetical protein
MKKILLLIISLTIILASQDTSNNPDITQEEIKAHIKYLASDELEGRLAGSEGGRKAAEYIKDQFTSYGLLPFYNGSYFQEFEFIQSIELGDNNSINLSFGDKTISPELKDEFVVAPFSGNKTITAPLAFAGYGISSSKLNYDDYTGLDLEGKIAIIMRYNPEHDSAMSEFDRFSSLRVKASAARENGAVGVLFINGYKPNKEDELIEFKYDRFRKKSIKINHPNHLCWGMQRRL